jgi:hypothetical protein
MKVNRIHIEPQLGLELSGVALAQWLGNDVYTIAMTSYEEQDFLDLHALDGIFGHPMRKPQSICIDRYRDDTLTDVTRAFDAIFYVGRVAPATLIRSQGCLQLAYCTAPRRGESP